MEPLISPIGVYKVPITKRLFRQALKEKYGEPSAMFPGDAIQAEKHLQEELDGVVLIELLATNVDERYSAMDFGQPDSDQAAYDETYLALDSDLEIETSPMSPPKERDFKVVFFLHYYDPSKPLKTTYGLITLPPVQEMTKRLSGLKPYEFVC
jgi:hypothetical protein